MKKIATLGQMHDDGLKLLKNYKYSIVNISDYSNNNLKDKLKDVDAIALRTVKLTKDILKECKSLKIVARHGVGYDNVDLNYLNKEKIALAITGSANAVTVAEHVMTMFLNLCKHSKTSDQIVRSGQFDKKASMQKDMLELYKKNIFIIGFGRIGKTLAKRCVGFESNVFVYDPYIEPNIIKAENYFPVSFEEGIKIADFISVHLPLNEKTKYLITKKEFSKMKKTCIIVNTARGGIIKEEDLLWALKNHIIHSAGLDVFEQEPPNKNNPLFNLNNLILSPHSAALTLECRKRMSVETCSNILNYLSKSPNLRLSNIVNREILSFN
tara:strand:- start:272 stop:1249 length:978 start_codon:yes stop_codon:yes gene_type:complete